MNEIIKGNCLTELKKLEDRSVNCCVTSPPYWGLRDYDHNDQLGQEKTPEEYVEKVVQIFREVKRVLKDDGTLWLNLGDSYAGSGKGTHAIGKQKQTTNNGSIEGKILKSNPPNLKSKDLVGIPWMVAFALRADGWYLRQDIIWCLSGGTIVYAQTQKGEMPTTIKDLSRLDPKTVKLWNGKKWTQLLGISKSLRQGNEIEIVLRSGERISCTPTHKFPTNRGLLKAKNIKIGDCLESTQLPEPINYKNPKHIGLDVAWFAGLYLADGSKSNDCIQISGHSKDQLRWYRLNKIVKSYGGYITRTVNGNKMDIRVYGKILNSFISEFISGKTAKNKCLSPSCWKYSNDFLQELLNGYLSGDGHLDIKNKRWRLGFTRNYNFERDLRVLSSRLGFNLTLNLSNSFIGNKKYPSFRGEIRFDIKPKSHGNQKKKTEVVEIRKARARKFYDIGVKDKPNLFALGSGVLTHNSKPNPMPESVTDRCTKSHEYIFLMSKSKKYYYDQDAIKTPLADSTVSRLDYTLCFGGKKGREYTPDKNDPNFRNGSEQWGREYKPKNNFRKEWNPEMGGGGNGFKGHSGNYDSEGNLIGGGMANKKSVWTVATKPFKEAHFATFPQELIIPCIKAGCPENGIILDCFMGAGTTALVARKLNRNYTGIELNESYIKIANQRLNKELGMFI